MEMAYCVDGSDPAANSLIEKLARYGKPGSLIRLTSQEMRLLLNREKFTPIYLPDNYEAGRRW